MVSSIYTLPQISFVGGETQKLTFSLFKRMGTKSEMPYDATGATVDFSLINYSNKIGIPILSKSAKIKKGEESSYNWAEVILNPQDTAALYGKYIYQLTIKDMWGDVSIPNQGIMLITKNINQLFCL